MNAPAVLAKPVLALPSDQDATGRTLGAEEIEQVSAAIRSGTLTSTKGEFTKTLEQRFAERVGVRHAYACASGTAAIHTAIAAIDPEPGDEIVTTPITDMGALDADPLPGRDPGLRRRRSAHLQRHRGDDRGAPRARARRRSSSRTCSATRATWTPILALARRAASR